MEIVLAVSRSPTAMSSIRVGLIVVVRCRMQSQQGSCLLGARHGLGCGILRSQLKCRFQLLRVTCGGDASHGVHKISIVPERAAACPAKAEAQQTLHHCAGMTKFAVR